MLRVFAADSSHLLNVLGFDQAGLENRALTVEACEEQVSEKNSQLSECHNCGILFILQHVSI